MRKLFLKLAGSAAMREAVKFFRFHKLANWWLHKFPFVKNLPGTSIRYRARRLESIALAVEMFDQVGLYSLSGITSEIRTFADLGCNVGYFTCWLHQQSKGRSLKGLMVDANPEAVEDAQWHAEINGWHDVHAMQGLVGSADAQAESEFYLHTSNVCSTDAPPKTTKESAASWTKLVVPGIRVEQNWTRLLGDLPCDLLKLDVEGLEMDFLKVEEAFLERVKAILVEWHKWRVAFPEIESFLETLGFKLVKVLHDGPDIGTALLSRKP